MQDLPALVLPLVSHEVHAGKHSTVKRSATALLMLQDRETSTDEHLGRLGPGDEKQQALSSQETNA